MKILHVLPSNKLTYGGPVNVARALSKELNNQGHFSSIFPINQKSFYFLGRLRLLTNIFNSDIIHIHGLWHFNSALSIFFARLVNKKYVITPHGMLDIWSLSQSRIKKKIYSFFIERRNLVNASAVHFLNFEELLESKFFEKNLKTFVLPNGVDLNELGITSLDNYDLKSNHYTYMLFLGRLNPKKGFDILIPAFKEALESCPGLKLLIAGPDQFNYKSEIINLLIKYGIKESSSFLGMLEGSEKSNAFRKSDFFILPSYQEGDSVAVKEAMAFGLPVIITPSCHLNEVTKNNAGFVVQPNIDSIKNAIIQLYSNKSIRKNMGFNAKELIHKNYIWKILVVKLINEYNKIINYS